MGNYFRLKDFKVGEFTDNYGNTWCNAIWHDYSEPTIWVVKDPGTITIDRQYYGTIRPFKNKNGKETPRFYKEQEPDINDTSGTQDSSPPYAQESKAPRAAAESRYLRDETTAPIDIYNGSLDYASTEGLKLISNTEHRRMYLEYVKDVTEEMLKWIEEIRNG